MKSKRFENAISALVEAFFNDTLAKGNCSACAVGNICAKAIGEVVVVSALGNKNIFAWRYVFSSDFGLQREYSETDFGVGDYKSGLELISKTGYSKEELMKVEHAFEKNSKIEYYMYKSFSKNAIMEDQYKGLMAVVEVLCEIEGLEPAEYKKMFEYSV